MKARRLSLTAPLLLLLPWNLSAQQHPAARDAFWSASDLISVAPNPAAHRHPTGHAKSHTQDEAGRWFCAAILASARPHC